ncbi:hypothetical protein [Nocardia cyriacigeorgica]|uniref:hypothetical protein n=1 Tax=Nocardia cyriacigeorgica TaxID=135487 RepID=UPI0018961B02|nr:hypothetical protein [Nocardia cyriacigeorgica]MBF6414571.1 hypothetical protein [Nocardia cyriacigeorgica]
MGTTGSQELVSADPIKMGNIADMCSFGVDEDVELFLRADSVKPRELDRFASNWSN